MFELTSRLILYVIKCSVAFKAEVENESAHDVWGEV
jgi:hypothetical protein